MSRTGLAAEYLPGPAEPPALSVEALNTWVARLKGGPEQRDKADQGPVAPMVTIDTREMNVAFIHSQLDDYGLSPQQFRLYCHLARRAQHGLAWSSVARMGEVCRMRDKTVRSCLKKLLALNMLEKYERPGQTTQYRLTRPSVWRGPHPSQKRPGVPFGSTQTGQAHPSQTRPGEVYPNEVNPKYTPPPGPGLPLTAEDAIARARAVGVLDDDYVRTVFLSASSEGWRSTKGNLITHWENFIRGRYGFAESRRSREAGKKQSRPLHPVVIKRQLDEVRLRIKEREAEKSDSPEEHQECRKALKKLREREKVLSDLLAFGAPGAPADSGGEARPQGPGASVQTFGLVTEGAEVGAG